MQAKPKLFTIPLVDSLGFFIFLGGGPRPSETIKYKSKECYHCGHNLN